VSHYSLRGESVPEREIPKACRRNDYTSYLVEPELLAEIEYRAKSAEGKVPRGPAGVGLRHWQRGLAAIAGSPSVDQLVIIAEDAITTTSCSRISDGK
jgi:hypothetical protein